LSVYVEYTSAVAVVRPHGGHDGHSVAGLRTAVYECLADQPVGIVVDAADLSTLDGEAIEVIAEAARQSERWPGAQFALAHASPVLLSYADRLGALGSVMVYPDVSTARSELGKLPVPPRFQLRISPDRSAPYRARTAVQDFCMRHAPAMYTECEHAQLVASELITNAVMHADTPMVLTLRLLPDALSIAVRDGDLRPALMTDIANESSERGRGLLLVDAFADSWGNFFPSSGKVVWAKVRLPSTDRHRQPTAQPANVARDERPSLE